MIFRAPIGHTLLHKNELNQLYEQITNGDSEKAIRYLEFCIEEITFYDYVRKQTELKKMLKEEGDSFSAKIIEKSLHEKIRQRQEISKLLKSEFLI